MIIFILANRDPIDVYLKQFLFSVYPCEYMFNCIDEEKQYKISNTSRLMPIQQTNTIEFSTHVITKKNSFMT